MRACLLTLFLLTGCTGFDQAKYSPVRPQVGECEALPDMARNRIPLEVLAAEAEIRRMYSNCKDIAETWEKAWEEL